MNPLQSDPRAPYTPMRGQLRKHLVDRHDTGELDEIAPPRKEETGEFTIAVRRFSLLEGEHAPTTMPFDTVRMVPELGQCNRIVYRVWTGVYTYEDHGKQRKCVYYAYRAIGPVPLPYKEREYKIEPTTVITKKEEDDATQE